MFGYAQSISPIRLSFPLLFMLGAASACAVPREPPSARETGQVITATEIERSGAGTVWQVLRNNAAFLELFAHPRSRARVNSSRYAIDREPLVLLDGARITPAALAAMSVGGIQRIRIYSVATAPAAYARSGAGVILIETR